MTTAALTPEEVEADRRFETVLLPRIQRRRELDTIRKRRARQELKAQGLTVRGTVPKSGKPERMPN